jgi:hypothetical protein
MLEVELDPLLCDYPSEPLKPSFYLKLFMLDDVVQESYIRPVRSALSRGGSLRHRVTFVRKYVKDTNLPDKNNGRPCSVFALDGGVRISIPIGSTSDPANM